MPDFLLNAVYSGPFIPLMVTFLASCVKGVHVVRNCVLLLSLTGVQAIAWLPYVDGRLHAAPDEQGRVLASLFLPFLLGIFMFPSTLVYAVIELFTLWRSPRKPPAA